MTPIELFGVFVRLSGFLLVIHGTISLIWGFAFLISWKPQPNNQTDNKPQPSPFSHLFFAGMLIPLGLFIVAQADAIARLSYPPTEKPLPTKPFRI